jgi:hypothetical protein
VLVAALGVLRSFDFSRIKSPLDCPSTVFAATAVHIRSVSEPRVCLRSAGARSPLGHKHPLKQEGCPAWSFAAFAGSSEIRRHQGVHSW